MRGVERIGEREEKWEGKEKEKESRKGNRKGSRKGKRKRLGYSEVEEVWEGVYNDSMFQGMLCQELSL
eukprot:764831-Hanusia_phi.AAC.4